MILQKLSQQFLLLILMVISITIGKKLTCKNETYIIYFLTFRQVLDIAREFCSDDTTDRTVPPLLLLLLSR